MEDHAKDGKEKGDRLLLPLSVNPAPFDTYRPFEKFATVEKGEKEWQQALDCIDDVVMLVDRDGLILRVNSILTKTTGKLFGNLIGCEWQETLREAGFELSMESGRKTQYSHPNGNWYSLRTYPLENTAGSPCAATVITLRNVTDLKVAEERLAENAAFLETLLDTLPSPIYYKDKDGIYRGCNKAFADQVHGLPREKIVGKSVYDLPDKIPLDMANHYYAQDRKLLDEPGTQSYELCLRCNDKKKRAFFFSRSTYRDGAGKVAGIVGIMVDITARKEAEARLAESEERYRVAIEHSNDGVALVKGNKHVYVNQRFLQIFGYNNPEEIVGQTLSKLVHPDHIGWIEEMNRKRQNGESVPSRYQAECIRKDGSSLFVEVSATGTSYRGDSVTLAFLRDVTEQKLAEEYLNKSRIILEAKNSELELACEELKTAQSRILQQEKMASIGQLAAGVAHEINNPIGFITSNLNSLKKYAERLSQFQKTQAELLNELAGRSKEKQNILSKVREERRSLKIDYITQDLQNLIDESLEGTDRVKRIVQDLKTFSHVDEKEYKTANLNSGLESTINIVWNELKYKTTVDKEYGAIPATVCNLGQLNQVFMNILLNAAQAIARQGTITVRTWHENNHISVSISDTGCGIPEDKVRRIFDPFFTTKEVGKGTGLGLSIAYDIVKKHNGDIKVVSKVGKGTTFTIEIPVVEG